MSHKNTSHTASIIRILGLILGCAILAGPASAYTGPGLGMATITIVLGFFASIFIALFAIIWYPFKRMMKKRKTSNTSSAALADDTLGSVSEPGDQTNP